MIECPKCKRKSMSYDARCKTMVCLEKDCNYFVAEPDARQSTMESKVVRALDKKDQVIIEIKGGALWSVYSDVDADFILVDHDEIEGGISSASIIPDHMSDLPFKTKQLAVDAVMRTRA